jgi:hypothetical protein
MKTLVIGGTQYDVVLAMYGQVATVAEVFAGRCGHLISAGGVPAYRGCLQAATVHSYGMAINDNPTAAQLVMRIVNKARELLAASAAALKEPACP